MDAYRLMNGMWFCGLCAAQFRPEAVQGPFPEGGGLADWPRRCFECHALLGNPLTQKGIVQTREYVDHPHCPPEQADALRAFYGGALR